MFVGLIAAAIAIGVLMYIGWFDARTHVDTPAGDNVTRTYPIEEANASAPGEAAWQNADTLTLDEIITELEPETPPVN